MKRQGELTTDKHGLNFNWKLTEGGLSSPPYIGNGEPTSRRGRQECPHSFHL